MDYCEKCGREDRPLTACGDVSYCDRHVPQPDAVDEVSGTVRLMDGSTSQFRITAEGWFQWGAVTERLGRTTDALDAVHSALGDVFYRDGEEGR